MIDEQLTREFSSVLPADVVHREVASISKELLWLLHVSQTTSPSTIGGLSQP